MSTLGNDLLSTIQNWIATKYTPAIVGLARTHGNNLTAEIVNQALSLGVPQVQHNYAPPPPLANSYGHSTPSGPSGPSPNVQYATPNKCPMIFKGGQKAGQVCGAKLAEGLDTCFIHSKSKNGQRAPYPPGSNGVQQNSYGGPPGYPTVTAPPPIMYTTPPNFSHLAGDISPAPTPSGPSSDLHLEQWRDNFLIHGPTGFVVKRSGNDNFVIGIAPDRQNMRPLSSDEKTQSHHLGLKLEVVQQQTYQQPQYTYQQPTSTQQHVPQVENKQNVPTGPSQPPPTFPQLGNTSAFAGHGQPVGVGLDQLFAASQNGTANVV